MKNQSEFFLLYIDCVVTDYIFRMTNQGEKKANEDEHKLVKKIKNYIYDPVQIIGSGFSSNVYKGLNELNGETIAIKVLELGKIQSEV